MPGPQVDASSPPGVSGTTNPSLATASFTPPAGALLLLLVGTDGSPGFNVLTIADSLGGAWQLVIGSGGQYGGAIYRRTSPTTGAAMTVTVTGDHNFATGLEVAVITGHDPVTPIRQSVRSSGAAGTIPTLALTTQSDNALAVGTGTADTTTYTPVAGTSFLHSWTGSPATAAGFMPRVDGNKTPPGQATLGTTNASPNQGWTLMAVEVQAVQLGSGTTVVAGDASTATATLAATGEGRVD